ncbi:NADPH-dependent F420 reductase [Candidatus Manganitrophus noduliformans]|uniref:NADP oxidoreductase n=1 Tax=Candidatus Manganitrophus noduliformans TaxID=2606439 RepID=A0A7X6ICM0_9BACT|nr:NAD(P)-binding domain-containing protein [Candidatus Manganitrophus noduliformans]NKE72670.1 NADP oxidoreductase [Candidatus Manganitrophus noduliformans]
MKPKIGIIGEGNVGGALRRGLERVKYEVRSVGNDPKGVRETASWGEAIILAVPFNAVEAVVREIREAVSGKVLLDVTNVLTPDYQLALGCTTSGAEELQKKVPGAKVIKAFNTAFAGQMDTGRIKNEPITLFVAGDDETAKATVTQMGREIGFDPVDAGPLQNARWLETLGYFHIQLGYTLKMGTQIEFKLIR